MRSFFVVCAVLLSFTLLPATVLAVKKTPKPKASTVVGQASSGSQFPRTLRTDFRGGKTTITLQPSRRGDSAWFFAPCGANTKGIFPANSSKPVGDRRHSFSCRLLGEKKVTYFDVVCMGNLNNNSAMYTALDPSMPFFQISLECSVR